MNIHAGNDADNCDACADPERTLRDYASLSMLAPTSSALRADVRVTRWLIQQPSADWKTRLQSPRGHEGGRNEWDERARLAEADYAEGILSASERASVRASVSGNKDAIVRDLF